MVFGTSFFWWGLTNLVLHDDGSETVVLQGFVEDVEANTSYKHAFLILFANKISNGIFHFQANNTNSKGMMQSSVMPFMALSIVFQ